MWGDGDANSTEHHRACMRILREEADTESVTAAKQMGLSPQRHRQTGCVWSGGRGAGRGRIAPCGIGLELTRSSLGLAEGRAATTLLLAVLRALEVSSCSRSSRRCKAVAAASRAPTSRTGESASKPSASSSQSHTVFTS